MDCSQPLCWRTLILTVALVYALSPHWLLCCAPFIVTTKSENQHQELRHFDFADNIFYYMVILRV